ncbi:tetratricopeptide repeat protein [Streptomyces sp. NPDC002516]
MASDLTRGWRAMRGMSSTEQQDELHLHQIIVRHDPTNSSAHNNLGNCFAGAGRWADAEDAFRQALRHDPTNSSAHNNLGNCLFETGRLAEAEDAYRQALRHDPTNSDAHNGLGFCHGETERLAEAEDAFRQALRHDPTNSSAHNGLGFCHAKAGRLAEAEDAFRQALHRDPTNSSAHGSLGYVSWLQLDVAAAEASYRSALRADPAHSNAGFRLGLLLLDAGRTGEARTVLESARAGEVPRELLLAAALHPVEPARVSSCLQAALAACERGPGSVSTMRIVTPFMHAEEKALTLAAAGRGAQGATGLQSASGTRLAGEVFEKPWYDQLAAVTDPVQLEPVLQVWREIIAADPHACGPWGPPTAP